MFIDQLEKNARHLSVSYVGTAIFYEFSCYVLVSHVQSQREQSTYIVRIFNVRVLTSGGNELEAAYCVTRKNITLAFLRGKEAS